MKNIPSFTPAHLGATTSAGATFVSGGREVVVEDMRQSLEQATGQSFAGLSVDEMADKAESIVRGLSSEARALDEAGCSEQAAGSYFAAQIVGRMASVCRVTSALVLH